MRYTIALISLMLAGMASTASAITYDAATDFSTATNPNGVWTYGVVNSSGVFTKDNAVKNNVPTTTVDHGPVSAGTAIVAAHYLSSLGAYSEQGSAPGLNIVGGNHTGSTLYIDTVVSYNSTYPNRTLLRPDTIVMRSGNGTAYVSSSSDLRFTAPTAGQYAISAEMYSAFVPRSDYHNFHENCTVAIGGVTDQSQNVDGYYYANPYDTVTRTKFNYSKTVTLTAGETVDFLVKAAPGGAQAVGAQISISSVPEPGTMVLLASGLFGLLAYAWRKRK